MLPSNSTRSKEIGLIKSAHLTSSSLCSSSPYSFSETSQLDSLVFQIQSKEKKLQDLLTEYHQLVSAGQFDTKEAESDDLMIQLSKRESMIYNQEAQLEVYKYVHERTKSSNDSMKAKVKHLQRIRDRTITLYNEACESSTEAIKINNLETAKVQHLEAYIYESRDVRSKELTLKLEEIKQIAEDKSARNAMKTEDADSSLAKMRKLELKKRIAYFNRQKESSSILRQSLVDKRVNYRFQLNKLYRNLGSNDIQECIDKYFEVVYKHASMSMHTEELMEQLNCMLTQQKKLKKVLIAYKTFKYLPINLNTAKLDEKIDIIFKPQYDKHRHLHSEIISRESMLKKRVDIILQVCSIFDDLIQRVENADKYNILGPKNGNRLPIQIKNHKSEQLEGILESIFTLTPNALMIVLLLEKKLVALLEYINTYYNTHRIIRVFISNTEGKLTLIKKNRAAVKRATILDAYNVDLKAKNLELIKKNIYNSHFIDTGMPSKSNLIYDMITGAAQVAEDYRKTLEKMPKKVESGKVDFNYPTMEDETLKRNKELAIVCENPQGMASPKPESRSETIKDKRQKKAMDLGNILHSMSQNEIPVLPYIHRSVKNLTARTNRLRMTSNADSLSSLFQDISKMKTELYKIGHKSTPKGTLSKFPNIHSSSRSEMSSPISMTMKPSESAKIFKLKGK